MYLDPRRPTLPPDKAEPLPGVAVKVMLHDPTLGDILREAAELIEELERDPPGEG